MANVFSKNAYNTLGLETNASIKEVNRRAKEIIRLAEIGNDKVDGDLGILNPDRSPSAINEALDKISAPKNQLKEYFFGLKIMIIQIKKQLIILRVVRLMMPFSCGKKNLKVKVSNHY